MPNWCFSSVYINGTKEQIDVLDREFSKALSSNPLEADFGDIWLGNLLYYIGIPKDEVIHGDTRCRGSVDYICREGEDTIHMEIESAWTPHIACIRKFCEHFAPDVEIIYISEEPGCELYWTNDPMTAGTVVVDYFSDEYEDKQLEDILYTCNGQTKEFVAIKLARFLKHDGTYEQLTEEIVDRVLDNDPGACINFYVYDMVPLDQV